MDLQLASVDEIFDELAKRFDAVVVCGRRVVDRDERLYAYKRCQHGEIEECVFLLHHHAHLLEVDYSESARDPEPWEEV